MRWRSRSTRPKRPRRRLRAAAGSRRGRPRAGSRKRIRDARGRAPCCRRSSTSASSLRVAGTRTTADQPPSTGARRRRDSRARVARARRQIAAYAQPESRRGRRRRRWKQIGRRHLHRRADRQKRVGDQLERRQRLVPESDRDRPPAPAELHLRQSERLRRPPSVNDSTSARRRNIGQRRSTLERIVGEHLVGDDRPPSLAADRRQPRRARARDTYEPVGLFGDTMRTAARRPGAARSDAKSISHRP